jgi:hypothetical protein
MNWLGKWLAWSVWTYLTTIFLIAGGVAWLMTGAKFDMSNPKEVKIYKTGFERDCFDYLADEMKARGQAVDYQKEALLKQVCTCNANAVLKIYQNQKSVKFGETVAAKRAMKSGTPEMKAAFQSCAMAYGL